MYAITAERGLLFTMGTQGLKSLWKAHTNSRPPTPLACPLPQPGLHPTKEGPTSTRNTRLHLCPPGGIPPRPQRAATALGQNCIYQNVTGLHLLVRSSQHLAVTGVSENCGVLKVLVHTERLKLKSACDS